MVCAVGWCTSMSLWCVRVSKCSRLSLLTCGDRNTQYMRRRVGSGTGPETVASVAFAAAMILSHAAAMCLTSKLFRRMRIFCAATTACGFFYGGEGGETSVRVNDVSFIYPVLPFLKTKRVVSAFPGFDLTCPSAGNARAPPPRRGGPSVRVSRCLARLRQQRRRWTYRFSPDRDNRANGRAHLGNGKVLDSVSLLKSSDAAKPRCPACPS